jgi:ketosteroid isomerase-like protein
MTDPGLPLLPPLGGYSPPMASENVELVRSIYAAWERGDLSASDWADEEIEWILADGPSPGDWTGLAGMKEAARTFMSAWEDFRINPEEFRELDDRRVLVLVRWMGHGKTSGVDLGQMRTRGASLFHIRAGKVTRYVAYLDRDRAFADLGLKE